MKTNSRKRITLIVGVLVAINAFVIYKAFTKHSHQTTSREQVQQVKLKDAAPELFQRLEKEIGIIEDETIDESNDCE